MPRSSKALKIRKGDSVVVIAGKDKGRRGIVERVLAAEQRVVVEGMNIVKRHTKPRPPANPQQAARTQQTGGVIEKAAPMHISNVALISPGSGEKTRVGYRVGEDGRKVRISRRDGVDLDETKGK